MKRGEMVDMQDKPIGSVFDEQIFQNGLDVTPELNREILELCCAPGTPQETLTACLGALNREQIKELADDCSLPIRSGITKTKMIEIVGESLVNDFSQLLAYLPLGNIEFLSRFNGQPQLVMPKDQLRYRDISHVT